jgi:hypothetical protein
LGAKERLVECPASSGYWVLEWPAAPNADYRFGAYVYADGEVNSFAKRIEASEDEYFWYISYERPDYDSIAILHKSFLDDLRPLLASCTRIKHQKGLLFGHFECEYRAGGEWSSIGGTSYLRFSNFNAPPVAGKVQEYQSGPVPNAT